VTLLLKLLVSK